VRQCIERRNAPDRAKAVRVNPALLDFPAKASTNRFTERDEVNGDDDTSLAFLVLNAIHAPPM
jgi:hypothetical protein